jgi:hypothetical protein
MRVQEIARLLTSATQSALAERQHPISKDIRFIGVGSEEVH